MYPQDLLAPPSHVHPAIKAGARNALPPFALALIVTAFSAAPKPLIATTCRIPYYGTLIHGLNQGTYPSFALMTAAMIATLKPVQTYLSRSATKPNDTHSSFRPSIGQSPFPHVVKDLFSGTGAMAFREAGFLLALLSVEPTGAILRKAQCGEHSEQFAAFSVGFFAGIGTYPFTVFQAAKEVSPDTSYLDIFRKNTNHFGRSDIGYRVFSRAFLVAFATTATHKAASIHRDY